MADDPDSVVLRYLRGIDGTLDRLIDDVGDLKVRVTALEDGMAGIHRRMDRFEARLDRIEKRLDLVDATH